MPSVLLSSWIVSRKFTKVCLFADVLEMQNKPTKSLVLDFFVHNRSFLRSQNSFGKIAGSHGKIACSDAAVFDIEYIY